MDRSPGSVPASSAHPGSPSVELWAAALLVAAWLAATFFPDHLRELVSWGCAAALFSFVVWRSWRLTRTLRQVSAALGHGRRLLRQHDVQRAALLGALSDLVFRLERDGKVKLLGGGPSEQPSEGSALRDLVAEESARLVARSAARALETSSLCTLEYQEGAGNDARAFEARLVPCDTERVVVFVRELTSQKRLHAELATARETALEAARLKTKFLATMSHEIRTPMNGVIGMTNLLLETPLSPEQREYAQIIQKSGKTLLLVIDDILDFAKIEAGKLELDEVDFDLRACVDECLEAIASQAQGKGLELGAVFESAVPSKVRGDPTRLRQILTNLLSNAVRFTETGSILVRIAREGALEDERLRFSVRDSGPGIRQDRLPFVFQPVLMGDGGSMTASGGTGLGLVITRELVHLMGGEIRCHSVLGEGSVFELDVQLSSRDPVLTADERAATSLLGARAVTLRASEEQPWLVLEQLSALGVEAISAQPESVVSTVALAQQSGGCLAVLVDARREVCLLERMVGELRRDPRTREVPLVLALPLQVTLPDAVRAEAARVLGWPVRQSELAACLFALRRRPDALPADRQRRAEGLEAHVLVADDDPINQRVMRRVLSQLGCTCELAEDGHVAVERALSQRFDVILMDCQMPLLDGFDAARQIRAREDKRRPNRILALTGSTSDEDRRLSREAGMDGFLSKPLSIEQLRGELERLLELPPERRAMRETFLDQSPRTVEAMRTALGVRDWAALARTARQLSAMASELKETQLAMLCADLVRATDEGAWLATERALELVGAEHAAVTRKLRERLEAPAPPA